MAHQIIKSNIERLLKERNWRISDLENRIGQRRNINNIFRGTSKNPTIEVMQSIAKAFNVEVQDLLVDYNTNENPNTELLLNVCNVVLKEFIKLPKAKNPTLNNIFSIIKEVYEYSVQLNLNNVDINFTKWLIQKHYKS